jgi:hypothetical protein
LVRAVRRFEQDGNQIMLLWLLATMLLIYFTPLIQIHFGIGLILALAYFGVRSAEDFWFRYIPRTWRYRTLVALLPILALSLLLVLLTPVYPLMNASMRANSGYLLERDYNSLFQWLRLRPTQNSVVLAAPEVGLWLPAWSGHQVVFGAEEQTLDGRVKRQAVEGWYRDGNGDQCGRLLTGAYSVSGRYAVRYVVYGPRERALGEAPCIEQLALEPLSTFGEVELYAVDLDAG